MAKNQIKQKKWMDCIFTVIPTDSVLCINYIICNTNVLTHCEIVYTNSLIKIKLFRLNQSNCLNLID